MNESIRIAILDDEPSQLEARSRWIKEEFGEDHGVTVATFRFVEDMVEAAGQGVFDLVISDLFMRRRGASASEPDNPNDGGIAVKNWVVAKRSLPEFRHIQLLWVSVQDALNDHAWEIEKDPHHRSWFDYVPERPNMKGFFLNKVKACRQRLIESRQCRRLLKNAEGREYLANVVRAEFEILATLSATMTLDDIRSELPKLCELCSDAELIEYHSLLASNVTGESPASLTERVIAKKARISVSKFQKERAGVRQPSPLRQAGRRRR